MPDFIKMEHEILAFWTEQKCFEKLREKNNGNERFRFLDGPITANNPMGIHHSWGRSIKDIVLRYKAMNGYSCHYRNGFDTQGLWVEVEVEKELGFRGKKDIEAYGLDRFTRKCVERIMRFSSVITQQSNRLGQWMDWENSYYTHTDENISAIWHFLKICYQNGWIVKADRPMPWCPRCGTSLSEHEMSGSYKEKTHTAVFALAPVKNKNIDLLVWTTMPWTLSVNTALAVNPELDYAQVLCENRTKPFILAKSAVKALDGKFRVQKLLKGTELLGLQYETFLPELTVQKELAHHVIGWALVEAEEGSGIVHIAPGCGAEDYELGKAFSLPALCPIDDNGVFTQEYGLLSGLTVASAAPIVIEMLREQGKLFITHDHIHSYPVCWRCKTEVLYRLVKEWYIKTDEIRPKLLKAAKTVHWEPQFIGKRMEDWLSNMGDWNISRKRFYGLPLPFYPCDECEHLTVLGSKEELISLGGSAAETLTELHRPFIDEIAINCPNCGSKVRRVPEIGDVWLDAGIVPFSTLGYFSDREEWTKNFPAEWITEMQEQVRLWFYAQLFMSVTITGRAPYEKVTTNNWVLAEDGSRFSKTGYMIRFDEAAEKLGSDAIRYLFAGASPTGDVRFGYWLGEDARRKLLGFYQICAFFMIYAEIDKPVLTGEKSDRLMDRWLHSRIGYFIEKADRCYENYSFPVLIKEFEVLIGDVSNWYVRINRRRFWKNTFDCDKQNAYESLYFAIKIMVQIMAPVIPFLTEYIWQNLILQYGKAEQSVHLSEFPVKSNYDVNLLNRVEKVRDVLTQALKLRNDRNLKVRQPLSALYLNKSFQSVYAPFEDILKDELNVKEIIYLEDFAVLYKEYLSVDVKTAGRFLKGDLSRVKILLEQMPESGMSDCVSLYKTGRTISISGYDLALHPEMLRLNTKALEDIAISKDNAAAIHTGLTTELRIEGIYREILRHCQVLRKEAGFDVTDRVVLWFETSAPELQDAIEIYKGDIMSETLSKIEQIAIPHKEKEVRLDEGSLTVKIKKQERTSASGMGVV